MTTASRQQQSNHDDDPQYLAEWAAQVAAAISPNELRELLREYRRLSRDTSGSAGDLRHARLRAKALDSAVKQYP
jgi:hypothetical protein